MSKAQGQFTIIDYNDALTLTGYIGSNHARTQMNNPDNASFNPDWKTTNLVLTPSLYIIGTTTDQITYNLGAARSRRCRYSLLAKKKEFVNR